MRQTHKLRFFARVETTMDIDQCWIWRGYVGRNGYPYFGNVPAYRLAYKYLVGPIPVGLSIDHLCRNPRCVNPNHLEAIPIGENVLRGNTVSGLNMRKTHCKNGHLFSIGNTYYPKRGGRQCRKCRAAAERVGQKRRALAKSEPTSS